MERSIRATHNQFAVSANVRESAINTPQTLDTGMLFDIGNLAKLVPRRKDNSDQAIGKEEADVIYDNGATSVLELGASMAMPQHFAFFYGYGLGNVVSAAQGDGHLHTITPIDGKLDSDRGNPSFTLAQRLGKTLAFELFSSFFFNQIVASFKRDDWVKIVGQCIGTGKYESDIVSETVSAAGNATSLTLAANGVAGSSADERLTSIHEIKVELTTGVHTQVVFSAASNATPAVITITSPGGTAGMVDYTILYRKTAPAWATLPARVTEDALKVSRLTVLHGGKWTGTAFSGGRVVTSELNSLEHTFQNNGKCEFVPGAAGDYAGAFKRGDRTQKIKLDREFREFIFQQHITDNDTFGLYIKAEGLLYDATYKHQVEIIFPKCGVMTADPAVNDKELTESVDVKIMEDSTYGSVIVKVQNLVEKYAAAS